MKITTSEMISMRKSVLSGMAFFLTVGGLSAGYAAYSTLTASPGETLTKDKWNEMIQYAVPPGAIVAFNGNACPAGWDLADGTGDPAVGGGTNSMDLRGRFIRGSDPSATNDVDFASRSWGNGANKVGSTQGDEIKSHSHALPSFINIMAGAAGGAINPLYRSGNENTQVAGGNETRPKNVAAIYCIKQ